MSSPGPNPNVPQISQPTADLQSLAHTVQLLKQAVDNLAGFRGEQFGRAITFNDLIRLGLADAATINSPQGAADFATNTSLQATSDSINGTITNFTSTPHTWIAKQKFSSADGTVGVLISGASKGVQFVPSASGITIEATDNTGAGHQPLVLDGSTITLQISDVDKITLTSSTLTVVPNSTFNGTLGVTGAATVSALLTAQLGATITGAGVVAGAPTGGDKGAGSVNSSHLYINGTELQTVATNSSVGAAGPVSSTTGSPGTMLGFGGTITPSRSGTVRFAVHATGAHNTAGRSFTANIRTGTGTPPSAGAAATGTVRGQPTTGQSSTANNKECLAAFVIVSGLVVGTTYWYDCSLDNGAGGTATATDGQMDAVEL